VKATVSGGRVIYNSAPAVAKARSHSPTVAHCDWWTSNDDHRHQDGKSAAR